MPRRPARLTSGLLILAAIPVAALALPSAVQAGDYDNQEAYDLDCDDMRDPVDADETATVKGVEAAGEITVMYYATGEIYEVSQYVPGIAGSPEAGDGFGHSIASYDATEDGCDDLIVGAPGEDVAGKDGAQREDAGMIWIIPGSPSGLEVHESRGIHLDSAGVPGAVAAGDRFGDTLAAEYGAGEPMIAVGAPGTNDDAGAAYLLRGDTTHRITQDTAGVSGAAEPGDRFGEALSLTDRYLAVGAQGEAIGDHKNAGMAHVFDLADGTVKQRDAFHQDSSGITGTAEPDDGFGASLSIVAFRPEAGGAVMPLVSVGSPFEDLTGSDGATADSAGMAHLITVPSTGEHQQMTSVDEATEDVPGEIAGADEFGSDTAIVVRDWSGVGTPASTRWAVSAKQYDHQTQADAPEVYGFITSDTPGQSSELVTPGAFGLPEDMVMPTLIESDPEYLFLGTPAEPGLVYGLPWRNVFFGYDDPVRTYEVEK